MASLYGCLETICHRRRSVREFKQKAVSAEYIEKIKKIAYTSPYASGRKNWELVTVTDAGDIRAIAEVVDARAQTVTGEIREDLRESFFLYAKHFTIFQNAPALIIPTFRIAPGLSAMLAGRGDNAALADQWVLWERDNYVKSISCVAMLVLLAAESLGLGACYMTGPLFAEKEIGEVVKIKRGRNIGAIIPIGWPANKEEGDHGH